jgi:hypothetical protein
MLTAIFMMLLVSMILLLLSNTTATLFSQSTDNYKKEQASLLATSYTEFALLAIEQHHFYNNHCLEHISLLPEEPEGYQIDIQLHYLGLESNISCPPALWKNDKSLESSVLIDTFVRYISSTRLDTLALEKNPISSDTQRRTFHLRSLKKL